MSWLRKLAADGITPQDIYSVFALSLIPKMSSMSEDNQLLLFEATYLRDKFVREFTYLLRRQIKKYLMRGRYDYSKESWLNSYETASPGELGDMFNQATYRSEHHREEYPDEIFNEKWGTIAKAVERVVNSNTVNDIIMSLAGTGGLLNLVHNTQTSVLDKFLNGYAILDALNEADSGDPYTIVSKADPDIQKLYGKYAKALFSKNVRASHEMSDPQAKEIELKVRNIANQLRVAINSIDSWPRIELIAPNGYIFMPEYGEKISEYSWESVLQALQKTQLIPIGTAYPEPSESGLQGTLPFPKEMFDSKSWQFTKGYDGQYHCAFCNIAMSDEEIDPDVYTLSNAERNSFGQFKTLLPDGSMRFKSIARPVCNECLENSTTCESCGETRPDHDMLGDEICTECGATCDSCNGVFNKEDELSYHEGSGEMLCDSCFSKAEAEENSNTVQEAWINFYQEHPEWEAVGALWMAENQQRVDDIQFYVDLFDDMNWNDQYGGEKWAEIARTWKQLKEIRDDSPDGFVQNWDKAMLFLDHAFDLAHNNGSVFTKAPASIQDWLMIGLDMKRGFPPEFWINNVSPEVQKVLAMSYERSKTWDPKKPIKWDRHVAEENRKFTETGKAKVIQIFENDASGYNIFIPINKIIHSYGLVVADFKNTKYFPYILMINNNWNVLVDDAVRFIRHPSHNNLVVLIGRSTIQDAKKSVNENEEIFNMFVNHLRESAKSLSAKSTRELISTSVPQTQAEAIHKAHDWINLIFGERSAKSSNWSIKFAELSQSTFYDFYALTTVDCSDLIDVDDQKYCSFIKRYTVTQVVDDVMALLEKACIREARHVGEHVSQD